MKVLIFFLGQPLNTKFIMKISKKFSIFIFASSIFGQHNIFCMNKTSRIAKEKPDNINCNFDLLPNEVIRDILINIVNTIDTYKDIQNYISFLKTCKRFNKLACEKKIELSAQKKIVHLLAIKYNIREKSVAIDKKFLLWIEDYLSYIGNINEKDNNGWTLLHRAAYCNDLWLAKLLLKNNANVNERDGYDQTPLHRAVYSNSVELAKFLIDNGADINIDNKIGMKPLDLAIANRNQVLIDLIFNLNKPEPKRNSKKCIIS